MSVKLRASSGSYNVRDSELQSGQALRAGAGAAAVPKAVPCVVCFLDDTQQTFHIDKRAKAQTLLDKVYEHLELIEKDYFGLEFVDNTPDDPQGLGTNSMGQTNYESGHRPTVVVTEVMRWLDPLKTLKKQIRLGPPYTLYFRVKFYVSEPSKLQEEYTRYHFFLQVKKDIASGKLVVPYKTAVLLASYAVQSELGDYVAEEHGDDYLANFRFLPAMSAQFNAEVADTYRHHTGQTPADAEYRFLEQAKNLDLYGVNLHQAMDQSESAIELGVTSAGLVVFQHNAKVNTFPWSRIVKISFKRKQFFIQLRKEASESCENLIGFNMVSYRSCKNLWKSCVEHHTFFRLHVPPTPKAGLFGPKFRYSGDNDLDPTLDPCELEVSQDCPFSPHPHHPVTLQHSTTVGGRTEFQSQEENKRRARIERTFTRTPSTQYARRTVGASTRDAILTERGHSNAPHSNSLDNFRYPNSLHTSPEKSHLPSSNSYPLGFTPSSHPTPTPNPRAPHPYTPTHTPAPTSQQASSSDVTHTSPGGFQHTPTRSTLPLTDYSHLPVGGVSGYHGNNSAYSNNSAATSGGYHGSSTHNVNSTTSAPAGYHGASNPSHSGGGGVGGGGATTNNGGPGYYSNSSGSSGYASLNSGMAKSLKSASLSSSQTALQNSWVASQTSLQQPPSLTGPSYSRTHTPSPAPSLPASVTRSDSQRGRNGSHATTTNPQRSTPVFESASLDRKDLRRSNSGRGGSAKRSGNATIGASALANNRAGVLTTPLHSSMCDSRLGAVVASTPNPARSESPRQAPSTTTGAGNSTINATGNGSSAATPFESRSLRRSKRGRAATPVMSPDGGGGGSNPGATNQGGTAAVGAATTAAGVPGTPTGKTKHDEGYRSHSAQRRSRQFTGGGKESGGAGGGAAPALPPKTYLQLHTGEEGDTTTGLVSY